jgi:hypothetical protein
VTLRVIDTDVRIAVVVDMRVDQVHTTVLVVDVEFTEVVEECFFVVK